MSATEEQVVICSIGSWWNNASSEPVKSTAPAPPQVAQTCSTLQPIGGARAQSRFSGRTAKPIYSSPPVDGAPQISHAASAPSTADNKATNSLSNSSIHPQRRKGYTCDGSQPTTNSSAAAAASPSGAFFSRWHFNLDTWRWEVAADTSAGNKLAQHAIAARRWGDGRDNLAPAVYQSTKNKPLPGQTSTSLFKRRALDIKATTAKNPEEDGFASVGGFDKKKQVLLREVIYPLRHPQLLKQLGLKIGGRGVLLTGPPGSGKTHLARALAAEAGVHLEYLAGAECVGGGAAEERLRRGFAAAKNAAPSILFLDELDALAPARGTAGVSDTERQSTALTISLLDKLRKSGAPVAVIAASNRPDAIDAALRRPGRFDTELVLGPPNSEEREAILRNAVRAMPLDSDVDFSEIGRKLQGYMAADVAGVVLEAGLRCIVDAVEWAEATGTLELLIREDPEAMQSVKVGRCHFLAALSDMAPAILRGLAADIPKDVSWEDVGGLQSVKRELQELVEWPLVHGDRLNKMGLAVPAGALLYGPPGSGKTLLAKAVASCCGANFISVRGPELLQKWLGESEAAVRNLFERARAAAPCVIFFDEVDAVATRRDSANGAGGGTAAGDVAASRVLNQLLCEVDGLAGKKTGSGVFLLAATNRPAALDPALLRPGRLDKLLKVPLPDAVARGSILNSALRNVPIAVNVDLNEFAGRKDMEGFSGADVSELARRAGTELVREVIAAEYNKISGSGSEREEACLELRHLEAAMHNMRRSVSTEESKYYDSVEEKLQNGSLSAADVFITEASRQKAQQMAAAVAQAVKMAQNKHVNMLQARVKQLEQALREAGVEIPAVQMGVAAVEISEENNDMLLE